LYFSIKLWQQSTRERERVLRTEAEMRDARLSALRYQLNPHFLFNSLNAVSTLVFQEGLSSLGRWLPVLGHESGDRALGNLHSQLEQFPVNARRTPIPVRGRHPQD
jgi:Histidine kinase